MNKTVSRGPIARFISSGWPGFICLIALSTAIVFATPLAFAKKGGKAVAVAVAAVVVETANPRPCPAP